MLIYKAHLLLDCICVSAIFYVSFNGPNDFPMFLLIEKLKFQIYVLIDIRIALRNVFTELDTFQSATT